METPIIQSNGDAQIIEDTVVQKIEAQPIEPVLTVEEQMELKQREYLDLLKKHDDLILQVAKANELTKKTDDKLDEMNLMYGKWKSISTEMIATAFKEMSNHEIAQMLEATFDKHRLVGVVSCLDDGIRDSIAEVLVQDEPEISISEDNLWSLITYNDYERRIGERLVEGGYVEPNDRDTDIDDVTNFLENAGNSSCRAAFYAIVDSGESFEQVLDWMIERDSDDLTTAIAAKMRF
jgi:hypothetical protein